MEELYRMLLVRSPEALGEETAELCATDISTDSGFQGNMSQQGSDDERIKLAKEYAESDDFVGSVVGIEHGSKLLAIANYYADMSEEETGGVEEILATVVNILKSSEEGTNNQPNDNRELLKEYTNSENWEKNETNLKDSIVAIRYDPDLHRIDLVKLCSLLRAMRLVGTMAEWKAKETSPLRILTSTLFLFPYESKHEIPYDEVTNGNDSGDDKPIVIDKMHVDRAIDHLLSLPVSAMKVEEEQEEKTERAKEGVGGVTTIKTNRKVRLSSAALGRLPKEIRTILDQQEDNCCELSLDQTVKNLRTIQRDLTIQADVFGPFSVVNGTKIATQSLFKYYGLAMPDWALTPIVPVPKHSVLGCVTPMGVGDLLVVRQNLKRYEGGDIAHVENILQGEHKDREHRRKRTTEEIFTTEAETETSEERETQTTSRYEMRSEVQTQINEEISVEAGLKVSAQYGVVKMEADARFAYKNAKSESRKRASTNAKEVVDRAASKYSEKVREERTRKLVEEVEETNKHGVDATGASGHIVGIYQWLNKIYEAHVFNYGLRVMYDFMVPEPAAYYIWSLAQQVAGTAPDLIQPSPFTLSPSDIFESNYRLFVARYEANGVSPPPEPFVTIDINKSGGPIDKESNPIGLVYESDSKPIPDGYEYFAHSSSWSYGWDDEDNVWFGVDVSDVYDDPGSIPVRVKGYGVRAWSMYVHVRCKRTDAFLDEWRQNVWDLLHQGHLQQVNEYEEKLAALAVQDGIEITGRNPVANRKIERDELKKSSISLLTGRYPTWLNSILETLIGPFPRICSSQEQGAYVRFIEQAFEWENMTYVFYPYFWARATKWPELFAIQDIDPQFQDFLTSGFARVVVPVRPGFESAVEHFRQTGNIWSGAGLPDITDPDYLPIVEELKSKLGAPGSEEPVGDPWEAMVPTQLVKLRTDGSLPEWEKQEDGTWREKAVYVELKNYTVKRLHRRNYFVKKL